MTQHNRVPEIDRLADRLAAFSSLVSAKGKKCTHEDVRDAFRPVLELLGYGEFNRLHERRTREGRLDLRLNSDFGFPCGIVEIKSPSDTFDPAQLFDYMIALNVDWGLFTDGARLSVFQREDGNRIFQAYQTVLGALSVGEAADRLWRSIRKPEIPASALTVLSFVDGIQGRPISLSSKSGQDQFIERLSSPDSPFDKLINSAFLLLHSLCQEPQSYTAKSYGIWQRYFAPEAVRDEQRRRWLLAAQDLVQAHIESTPSLALLGAEEVIDRYMYSLETAYALVARLILSRVAEEFGLTDDGLLNWLRQTCRNTPRNLSEGRLFSAYVTKQVAEGLFPRLAIVFESLFREDFFDWWTDSVRAISLADISRSKIPPYLAEFAQALLQNIIAILTFTFRDVKADLLGDLYMRYFDPETRKALGEFYTSPAIVDYILDSVGYKPGMGITDGKMLIDPACGSGTFLIAALRRYFGEVEERLEESRRAGRRSERDAHDLETAILATAIERLVDGLAVCGLDINPFAVLVSQINYAIALVPYYKKAKARLQLGGFPIFRTDTLEIAGGAQQQIIQGSVRIELGESEVISFRPPTRDMLDSAGALNLADATKLLRRMYSAARGEAEGLVQSWREEIELPPNAELGEVMDSIVASLRELKTKVPDGRMMKWVGDELVVSTIKSGALHQASFQGGHQYHFVVFNPPYVTAYRGVGRVLTRYANLGYELASDVGKRDIAYLFLEWAANKLAPGGKIGVIVTDKWMEWEGREQIRRFVLRRMILEQIVDSGWVQMFERATNYVAIVIAERRLQFHDSAASELSTAFMTSEPEAMQEEDTPQKVKGILEQVSASFEKIQRPQRQSTSIVGPFFIANRVSTAMLEHVDFVSRSWSPLLRLTARELEVMRAFQAEHPPLSANPDFIEAHGNKAFLGIPTGGTEFFQLQSGEERNFNGLTVPTLEGTDVERWLPVSKRPTVRSALFARRFEIDWRHVRNGNIQDQRRMIFPYRRRGNSWERLTPSPRVAKHLQERLAVLRDQAGKRVEKTLEFMAEELEKSGTVYFIDKNRRGYRERRPPQSLAMTGSRIVWRDISDSNTFCLDSAGKHVPQQTCLYVVLEPSEGDDKSFYYLALMNSQVLEFYHKAWAPILQGGYFRYRPEVVLHYPLLQYAVAPGRLRGRITRLGREAVQQMEEIRGILLLIQAIFSEPVPAIRKALGRSVDFSATRKMEVTMPAGTIVLPAPLDDRNEVQGYLNGLTSTYTRLVNKAKALEEEIDARVFDLYHFTKERSLVEDFLLRWRVRGQ